ncbi:MAG TPA: c-type cytochrome domain-containing protein [Phnomibacter sp.]|nr:c-type cytochrome domain-containing protein [Phnomibacter sp.]
MANNYQTRAMALVLAAVGIITFMVQCTKEGAIAPTVSRALVTEPDSTVYSPFYDSTLVMGANSTPSVNDHAVTAGVRSIIINNCSSPACHGQGGIKPTLETYDQIKAMVVPGDPERSRLFQLITTNDLNRAMPPINYGVDLSVTEKTKIYNWILHGAKEQPGLDDFRPAAIQLIVGGCGSANCHNQATVGGAWARARLINVTPADTFTFIYRNPNTGAQTSYAQLKEPRLSIEWNLYKDSVRKYYTDTTANASFRPWKTMNSPVVSGSFRGPLNSYDDIIFDVYYPKSRRSTGTVQFSSTGQRFYVFSDHLNATSSMLSRVDSTMVLANPRTGVFANNHQGDMAFGDGGLSPSEIAQIKAWYFMDPNVPDIWKYGLTGNGIFRYRNTGFVIRKQ